jgi:hypothetical protein
MITEECFGSCKDHMKGYLVVRPEHMKGKIKMPFLTSIPLETIKKFIATPDTAYHPSEAQALWSEFIFYSPLERTSWMEAEELEIQQEQT